MEFKSFINDLYHRLTLLIIINRSINCRIFRLNLNDGIDVLNDNYKSLIPSISSEGLSTYQKIDYYTIKLLKT